HTRFSRDWSSDVCSSDLKGVKRLVSRDRFVDLARHLLVVLVAGAVAFGYAKDVAPDLARLSRAGAVAGLWVVGEALFGLALRVEIGRASCRARASLLADR